MQKSLYPAFAFILNKVLSTLAFFWRTKLQTLGSTRLLKMFVIYQFSDKQYKWSEIGEIFVYPIEHIPNKSHDLSNLFRIVIMFRVFTIHTIKLNKFQEYSSQGRISSSIISCISFNSLFGFLLWYGSDWISINLKRNHYSPYSSHLMKHQVFMFIVFNKWRYFFRRIDAYSTYA